MVDDWKEALGMLVSNPEKGALLLVVITGAWRWIRELFREHKEDGLHDVFMDRLLREDSELRAENGRLRAENGRLQRQLQKMADREDRADAEPE